MKNSAPESARRYGCGDATVQPKAHRGDFFGVKPRPDLDSEVKKKTSENTQSYSSFERCWRTPFAMVVVLDNYQAWEVTIDTSI